MRKTLLWKNAKPPLPGSPCHCRCYGVAAHSVAVAIIAMALLPTVSLLPQLLRCPLRWCATPERRETIPTRTRKHIQMETKEKDLDRPAVGFEGYRYQSDMIEPGT